MSAMSVELPEGASIQIIVGRPPLLALPDETGRPAQPVRRGGFGRTVLTGLAGLAVLGGGYVIGQHSTGPNGAGGTVTAQAAIPAPPPVRQSFPDHAGAPAAPAVAPGAPASAQVPPAFTQELHLQPTVVPPPGQTSGSAASAKNPFGLEN
jgi:hypothetical protein